MSNDWIEVPPLNHFGYYESPTGMVNDSRPEKRKFFESGLRWDPEARKVVMHRDTGVNVRDIMERGGAATQGIADDAMEVDDENLDDEDI